MTEVYILQNQDKFFLSKNKEWVDGRDLNELFKTPHKDEAVNQMFEVSSKDYKQRIKMLHCSLNEKGLPQIDPEIMPELRLAPSNHPLFEALAFESSELSQSSESASAISA